MKLILIIAWILDKYIVQSQTASQNTGCLKLSQSLSSQECLVCDTLNGYVLQLGACIRNQIPNCLLSYEPIMCRLCDYGYFLDGSFQCAEVPVNTFAAIPGCNHYLTLDRCLVCDMNNYLRNQRCRPTTAKMIPDCTINADETSCKTCNLQLLDSSGKGCSFVEGTVANKNCMFFRSPLSCKTCKAGFRKDPNAVLKSLDDKVLWRNLTMQLRFWKEFYFSIVLNAKTCIREYDIPNCEQLGPSKTCLKCSKDYVLSTNKTLCFVMPQPPKDPSKRILNCYRFATDDYEQCRTCYEGYILDKNNTACVRLTLPIDNCILRNQRTQTKCLFCNNEYFLNETETISAKQCVKRDNYIINCAEFDRLSDTCLKCVEGTKFTGTRPKVRCQPVIANCETFNDKSIVLTCDLCLPGFYPDEFNLKCIDAEKSTVGCYRYGKGRVCEECLQRYYLDSTIKKCFEHEKIEGCDKFSLTFRNWCDSCVSPAVNVQVSHLCRQVESNKLVDNCLQYNSGPECNQCNLANGFILYKPTGSSPSCVKKTTCLELADEKKSLDKCKECDVGFILFEKACYKKNFQNCAVQYINKIKTLYVKFLTQWPCQVCENNYFFKILTPSRSQVCLESTALTNCMRSYIDDGKGISDAYCTRCYRNYTAHHTLTTKGQCEPDDIFSLNTPVVSISDSNTAFAVPTASLHKLNSYKSTLLGVLTFLDLKATTSTWKPSFENTFSTASSVTASASLTTLTSPNTFCYQFSEDLTDCLSCKFFFGNIYLASSWTSFTNTISRSHSRWVYQSFRIPGSSFAVAKMEYEAMYDTLSPPVKACRAISSSANMLSSTFTAANPKVVHAGQLMDTYLIGGTQYHLCKLGENSTNINNIKSKWFFESMTMTIGYKAIDPTNFPLDWGTKSASAPSSMIGFGPNCKRVNIEFGFEGTDNCMHSMNRTNITWKFEERMNLNCQECFPNFILTVSYTKVRMFYEVETSSPNNDFVWILNECINPDTIRSTRKLYIKTIDNCVYYNATVVTDRPYFFCKHCNPGYYSVTSPIKFQCFRSSPAPFVETTSPQLSEDGCLIDQAECTKYKICKATCGATGCPTGQRCSQNPANNPPICVNILCTECPTGSTAFQCRNAVDNCPINKICVEGTCKFKCDCLDGTNICNGKTNFNCTPVLLVSKAGKNSWAEEFLVRISHAIVTLTAESPPTCNCPVGTLCEFGICVPMTHCPVCKQNEFCRGVLSPTGTFTFYCDTSTVCDSCLGTQYCQSTFNFLTGVSAATGCGDSPQWTFPYTGTTCLTCLPCFGCESDEVCVNGVCMRKLTNVCYFAHSQTVPVYCNRGKECWYGQCLKAYKVRTATVYDCVTAPGEFCWKGKNYKSHCPYCPRDSYCSVVPGSSPVQYKCIKSEFCERLCTGTNWCHGFYNFTLTTREGVFGGCLPYPQFTIENPYDECVNCNSCSPECTSEETCVGTACVPKLYNVCSFEVDNKYPLVCQADEMCSNSICVKSTPKSTQFTFPSDVNPTDGVQKGVYANGVLYLWTRCLCPRNAYCKMTKSAGGAWNDVCLLSPLVCEGTTFPQSELASSSSTESSVPTTCGPSIQYSPLTGVCASGCPEGFTCVESTCMPILLGVCSISSDSMWIPIYCPPNQKCVNSRCRDTVQMGVGTYSSCGASDGQFCINDTPVNLGKCPICLNNEVCTFIQKISSTVSEYKCVPNSQCNCSKFQFCSSTFDAATSVTTKGACMDFPQYTFQNDAEDTTCASLKPATEVCVKGVALPKLFRLCGLLFGRTVPVICQDQEVCINGVCYLPKLNDLVGVGFNAGCVDGKLCTAKTASPITLNQCPVCNKNQYCKVTKLSQTSFSYSCQKNLEVCQCSDTSYCHAIVNGADVGGSNVNIVVSSPIGCFPYPQFEMSGLSISGVASCSGGCAEGQQCISGQCVNNLLRVCAFHKKAIPVFCGSTSVCVKDVCVAYLALNGHKVPDSPCLKMTQFWWKDHCPSIASCPVCDYQEQCQLGSASTAGNLRFQCSTTKPSGCNDCTDGTYCQGTTASKTVNTAATNTPACSIRNNFGNLPNDFKNACAPSANPCIEDDLEDECTYAFPATTADPDDTFPTACEDGTLCVTRTNRHLLNQCKACTRKQFCKITLVASATKEYTYSCEDNALCNICVGTTFCWSELINPDLTTFVDGDVVTKPVTDNTKRCLAYAQFESKDIEVAAKCTVACQADQQCISGQCVNNLLNVCSFQLSSIPIRCEDYEECIESVCVMKKSKQVFQSQALTYCPPPIENVCGWFFGTRVPFVCPAGQVCINHACHSVSAYGGMTYFGCPANSLLINTYCYPLFHCPICETGSHCDFTIDDNDVAVFFCKPSTNCNTCNTNLPFCWVTVNGPFAKTSHTLTSKTCQLTPQLTMDLSGYTGTALKNIATCASCATGTCVNGVCIPSLNDYCSYTEGHTVPVKCLADEECVNRVCVHKSVTATVFTNTASFIPSEEFTLPKICPTRLTCVSDSSFCLQSDGSCTRPYLAQTCANGFLSVFTNTFVSQLTATVSPATPKFAKQCISFPPCSACGPNEVCVAPFILNESAVLNQNKIKYFFNHTYCVKTFWEMTTPYKSITATANYLKCRGTACTDSQICVWKNIDLSGCSGTYRVESYSRTIDSLTFDTLYDQTNNPNPDIERRSTRHFYLKDYSTSANPSEIYLSTTVTYYGIYLTMSDSGYGTYKALLLGSLNHNYTMSNTVSSSTSDYYTCSYQLCTTSTTRTDRGNNGCILTSQERLECATKVDFVIESERVATATPGVSVTTLCPNGYVYNTTAQKCLKAVDGYKYLVGEEPKNEANGCELGGIIYKNTCYYPRACPVCDHRSYCKVSQVGPIDYTYMFGCVVDAAKCTCPQGQYCHNPSTDPLGTPSTTSCQDYPQLGFSTSTVNTYKESTCSTACASTEVCVNGACFPKMTEVCSWLLNNTVAVSCGKNETCVTGKCVKECYPRCDFGFYCNYLTQTCVELQIYTTETTISSCVKIENCGIKSNYSRSLDGCDRCEEDYAFVAENIDESTVASEVKVYTLNKRKCERVNTANCLAAIDLNRADPSKAASYDCLECTKGYSIQPNLGCVISNQGCLLSDEDGNCLTCTWDYDNAKPLQMTDGIFPKGECQEISDQTFFIGTREIKIDPNCMNYDYNISDYQIWNANRPNPAFDSLNNPIPIFTDLAIGVYNCYNCKPGFFLNNVKLCLTKSIANCAEYLATSTATNILCKTCETYYFLSTDSKSCAMAPTPTTNLIPECEIYNPTNDCIKCKADYFLAKTGTNKFGQKTYCFKNVTEVDEKCRQINEVVFYNSQQIECIKCDPISGANAYPFPLSSSPRHACMKLAPQNNCVKYHDIFFNKTQSCVECAAEYYLEETTLLCTIRVNYPDASCAKFNVIADECQERISSSGTSISVTEQLPVLDAVLLDAPPANQVEEFSFNYNGWIMGCQIYEDNTTCNRCHPPRYLNDQGFDYNNKCLKSEVILPFCSLYAKSGGSVVCQECMPGFLFKNGACSLITAVNCLNYIDENQCKDCPVQFPVLRDGHCTLDNENPWCHIYEKSASASKFLCLTCLEGFYPNDEGICQPVKNPIANCLYHLFDGLCQKCMEGYVLQYDGKRCFQKPDWDPDCEEFTYKPECSLCEIGYFSKNNTCVKCVDIPENCAYCDPDDNKVCLLCKFGHQMTSDFKCVVNKDLPAGQLDPLLYRKWYGFETESGVEEQKEIPTTNFEKQKVYAFVDWMRGVVRMVAICVMILIS